ncbi:hypothetical protein NP493_523g00004 [Ridgeia piscesae]|uniref:Uncharacterized protein n=1 Tax=Ridgeia piscesae TaxID=27915 RepID=A0AAD9KWC5_RIDPI|nr:hypothetical protein NP493_523g00004 [Ridgeia piscesae]
MYEHRPCAGRLVWNNNKQRCDWRSHTCKCIVLPKGPVIDGQWSEWDSWSSCSVTCDGGQQQRDRQCDDPAPENGGKDCVGISTERRACSKWKCPGM